MTFFNPKFDMSPIKALAEREYASEYPQNIHWKHTLDVISICVEICVMENTYTPMTANDWNSSDNADFLRARPE
jgi:hypothetical protein